MAAMSVVIPVKGEEPNLLPLVLSLKKSFDHLGITAEVIVAADRSYDLPRDAATVIHVAGDSSRFNLLNTGAHSAHAPWLWFLHADSHLPLKTVAQGIHAISHAKVDVIYYAWLKFQEDGPRLVKFNALGANLRSWLFKCPFGDQGLLMSYETFTKMGGFPQDFVSGEDHAFIVKARRQGIKISPLNGFIHTSARKYSAKGWWNVTRAHLALTFKEEWR